MIDNGYKQVLQRSIDGIIIVRENLIVECNEALLSMFLYDSKDEILSLSPASLSPKYQSDGTLSAIKALEHMNQAIEQGVCRFEWLHRKKNSEDIFCEVTLTSLVEEDELIIFATLRDISNRKILERANQKLTERLGLAFSGNNDGIWDWDLENDTLYFSPSWKRMLGYASHEIESSFSEWEQRVHPDDLQNTLDDIQNYLDAKHKSYENRHRMKHKDGSWVWILDRGKAKFDEQGKALRFIGTHTNITREKNLEEELKQVNSSLEKMIEVKTSELRKSRDYFQTIINTVHDGMAILDLESNFILVNDRYAKMTGYTKEDLYQKSCVVLTAPEFLEESKKVIQLACINGSYLEYEKICLMKDGGRLPVRMDFILMPDKKQLLVLTKDIRDEKAQQREAELHDQQMLQQSRLAQMGEMISMIAHQWRQPLGAISTTAANLSLKLEIQEYELKTQTSREECSTYFLKRLGNIEGYVESLTNTIDDFRNFYKPNKNAVFISFEEVLNKALNIIKSSLSNDGVEIVVECNSKKHIEMYDGEMMQVILNILKNAQDNFLEKEIRNKRLDIEIDGNAISIKDNGGGISPKIVKKIFDPYFSTKNEKNGTGLGLYMSKIIVEEHHNGSFNVANVKDGVSFTIELKDGSNEKQ